MSTLKIGFAGFRHGHIFGLYGVAENNPDVEIVAAWEENDDAKKAAIEKKNVNFNCDTYEEILNNPDIDIVAIGDYYGRRGELAIKALKAGKHVIADKPLCTSLKELKEIKKLVKKTGLKVGLMLDLRYDKNMLRAKQLIEDGEIGEVNNILFGGQHPLYYGERPSWYFEEGKHGGTINDIAIHAMDIIKNYFKLDVVDICSARCWNKLADKEPQFKESAQFMLTMTNNVGVIADVSYTVPNGIGFDLPYYWEFKVWGTEGMICFCPKDEPVKLYKKTEDKVTLCDGIVTDRNYLKDFIDDINGKVDYTTGILASSEETLKIQAKAGK